MGEIIYFGPAPQPVRPFRQGGVQAQHIRNGALHSSGARVTGKVPCGGLAGPAWVIGLSDGTQLPPYRADECVPGFAPRSDLSAGPVKGSAKANRVGRRDGESAGDRHSRLVESAEYALDVAMVRLGRAQASASIWRELRG
jgi:hypothetical protein